jgi:hypothetical protein
MQDHPELMRALQALALSAAIILVGGCAHYPKNARMKHHDPQGGYRFSTLGAPCSRSLWPEAALPALRPSAR